MDTYEEINEELNEIEIIYIRDIHDIIKDNTLFIPLNENQIYDGFNDLLDISILARAMTRLHSRIMNPSDNLNNLYLYTDSEISAITLDEIAKLIKLKYNKIISTTSFKNDRNVIFNMFTNPSNTNIELEVNKRYKIIFKNKPDSPYILSNTDTINAKLFLNKITYVSFVNPYETLESRILDSIYREEIKTFDTKEIVNLKDYYIHINEIHYLKDVTDFNQLDDHLRRYNKRFYHLNEEDIQYIISLIPSKNEEFTKDTTKLVINTPINLCYQKNIFEVILEVIDIYDSNDIDNIPNTITNLNQIINNTSRLETFSSNLKDIIESINFEEQIGTIKHNIKVNNAKVALNILDENSKITEDYQNIRKNINEAIIGIRYNTGEWASSLSSYKSNQYEADIKEIREGLLLEDNSGCKVYEENINLDDEIGKTSQIDYLATFNEFAKPFRNISGYYNLIQKGLPYILKLNTALQLDLDIKTMLKKLQVKFEGDESLINQLETQFDKMQLIDININLSKKMLEMEIDENKKVEYKPFLVIHNIFEARIVTLIKYMLLELSFQISESVIRNNFKLRINQNISADCVGIYWQEYGAPLPKKIVNGKAEYLAKGPLPYLLCEFEKIILNDDVLYNEIQRGVISNGLNNILKLIIPNDHYSILQNTLFKLKLEKEEIEKKEKKNFEQKIVNIETNRTLDNYIDTLLHMPLYKDQRQIHKYILGCCKQNIVNNFHAFGDVAAIPKLSQLNSLIKEYSYSATQKDKPIQNIIGYSIAKDNLNPTQLIQTVNNYNESVIYTENFSEFDDTYLFEIFKKFEEYGIYNQYFLEPYIKQITKVNIIEKCIELSKKNIQSFCRSIKKPTKHLEERFLTYHNLTYIINIVFGEIKDLSDNLKDALKTFRKIDDILKNNIILKTERAVLTYQNLNKLICSMVLVLFSDEDINEDIILKIYEKVLIETRAYGLPTLLEYAINIEAVREDRKNKTLAFMDKLSPDEINYSKLDKEHFKDYTYIDFNALDLETNDIEDNDEDNDEDNYTDGNQSESD